MAVLETFNVAICFMKIKDWQHYLQNQWFIKQVNAVLIAGFDMLILNYIQTFHTQIVCNGNLILHSNNIYM